jgi:fibro-slime domain-containing protein
MYRTLCIFNVQVKITHLLVTLLCITAVAQSTYPPTLRVPVTLYDFHADTSNPEFQIRPREGSVKTGMVATTLGPDKKPTVGPSPFFNMKIEKWFQEWQPGDYEIYNYYGQSIGGRHDRYQNLPEGLATVDHDTSFKNLVFHDTLEFSYRAGSEGLYEFRDEYFFPLDGKGFGNEELSHNYSFTMELHWTFTMVPGLVFNFTGDDDVWAFVNNELAMDLGGIHGPISGSFNVDDIPGLVPNQKFSFDLFYAERHVTGSTIQITTNIIAPPSVLQLYDQAGTPDGNITPIVSVEEVEPGEAITIYGHVFDTSRTWRSEYDSLITWSIVSGGDNSMLSTDKGENTTLATGNLQHGSEVVLLARFVNPNDETQIAEVRLPVRMVKKEPPVELVEDHLDIVPDSATGRAPEGSFSSISISPADEGKELLAVVRDPNGTFIRFADNAQWHLDNSEMVTMSPRNGHRTVITGRQVAAGDETFVSATEQGLKPDTVTLVLLGREAYAILPNPLIPGRVDIHSVLPPDIIATYSPVINAAGTPYVTLVAIGAPRELVAQEDSYSEVQIYDAVGHIIRDDLRLIAGTKKLTYGVAWDGTNENGRRVGSGTYLAVIKAETVTGGKYVITQKIGINNKIIP